MTSSRMPTTFLLILLLTGATASGQVLLFEEDFDTGGGTFDLNTPDVGGTSGAVGESYWIVNDAYLGGSGTLICLGFPFSFTVNNTQTQPSGIPNNPNSTYLHTLSTAAAADNIFCSTFGAADGICFLSQSHFARMNVDVDTTSHANVTLRFWWNCGGGTNIHGEVYYSINQGTSWTLITAPISQYKNQSSWVEQSITLPAFSGQSNLRFAFRFANNVSSSALDPGFSIDHVRIEGDLIPVELQHFSID